MTVDGHNEMIQDALVSVPVFPSFAELTDIPEAEVHETRRHLIDTIRTLCDAENLR